MNPKAYLETTIASYLTARPSRALITAANQQMTHDWWYDHRGQFALYVSQFVIEEASAGDPEAAKRRLAVLADLPQLDVTDAVQQLAQALLMHVPLPANAQVDALYIAVATVHGMDYLVTWNCTHIANATLRHRIEAICRAEGYEYTKHFQYDLEAICRDIRAKQTQSSRQVVSLPPKPVKAPMAPTGQPTA